MFLSLTFVAANLSLLKPGSQYGKTDMHRITLTFEYLEPQLCVILLVIGLS